MQCKIIILLDIFWSSGKGTLCHFKSQLKQFAFWQERLQMTGFPRIDKYNVGKNYTKKQTRNSSRKTEFIDTFSQKTHLKTFPTTWKSQEQWRYAEGKQRAHTWHNVIKVMIMVVKYCKRHESLKKVVLFLKITSARPLFTTLRSTQLLLQVSQKQSRKPFDFHCLYNRIKCL